MIMIYDAFISHASEDKESFVRPLAQKLKEQNIEIWYDEFTLRTGDSIRREIDRGLSQSRYGIVILSPSFLEKQWPQWELDGLLQRELDYRGTVILPIWHEISRKEVMNYSPALADKFSISSANGIEYVVKKLIEVIKPEGSTLVFARDYLLNLGYNPPIVTDDWWLEMVEYDGSDPNAYDWAYSLYPASDKPIEKGRCIAQKSIQKEWQELVVEENFSQLTPPNELLNAIESLPGLSNIFFENLFYLISHAPQLTIPGFGGIFEDAIENYYQSHRCIEAHIGNVQLSSEGRSPTCETVIALRDPNFGYHRPVDVTSNFVKGPSGVYAQNFEVIDYLIWLLSEKAIWLPQKVRMFLLEGFKEWSAWDWSGGPSGDADGFKKDKNFGKLFLTILKAIDSNNVFEMTAEAFEDLRTRIQWSKDILELDDSVESLANRFLNGGFIEGHIKRWVSLRGRKKGEG